MSIGFGFDSSLSTRKPSAKVLGLHFLLLDFRRRVGLISDILPFRRSLIFSLYRFEKLYQGFGDGGFEQLWSKLSKCSHYLACRGVERDRTLSAS